MHSVCAVDFSDDCRRVPCCSEFTTCYEKNQDFAACKSTCAVGVPQDAPPWDPEGDGIPWTCNVIGTEQTAPAWASSTATPSLFCFALTLVVGNEPELLRRQLATGTGVFGCNAYTVFSEKKLLLGLGPQGQVTTTAIGGPMSSSQQNIPEFLRAWNEVMAQRIFLDHMWTVKIDPDTVLIPSRLRAKLRHHFVAPDTKAVYFANCAEYNSVQGPLEVFSRAAATVFFYSLERCRQQDAINQRGEDWFFGHCMESLGVAKLGAFDLLADQWCSSVPAGAVDCGADRAAFHPLKTAEGFMQCLEKALVQ